jgi:hypothetical protein
MVPDFLKFWKTTPVEEVKKNQGEKLKEKEVSPEKVAGAVAKEVVEQKPVAKEKVREPQPTRPGVVSLPELKTPVGASRLSTPKPSELNSPSEVSTKSKQGNDGPVEAKKSEIVSGSGIRQQNDTGSINNVLGYQTSVLEQILQSTNNLVSVNQDILRYTKIHT